MFIWRAVGGRVACPRESKCPHLWEIRQVFKRLHQPIRHQFFCFYLFVSVLVEWVLHLQISYLGYKCCSLFVNLLSCILILSNTSYLTDRGDNYYFFYLSTNIPACTAWTMLLNLGFSSGRRLATPIFLLKVHASQSRTSLGTDSACKSLSSSSVSNRRLQNRKKLLSVTAWTTRDLSDLFYYTSICQSISLFSLSSLTWSHRCKQRPTWQQRAPGSCGVPAGPRLLGPSAPGPPSAWQHKHTQVTHSTLVCSVIGGQIRQTVEDKVNSKIHKVYNPSSGTQDNNASVISGFVICVVVQVERNLLTGMTVGMTFVTFF